MLQIVNFVDLRKICASIYAGHLYKLSYYIFSMVGLNWNQYFDIQSPKNLFGIRDKIAVKWYVDELSI